LNKFHQVKFICEKFSIGQRKRCQNPDYIKYLSEAAKEQWRKRKENG
jgi:hypothetical protein